MKLIILDRDGVINEDSDAYIKSPEEWLPIPGSPEAIARLTQNGYRVAVATNQSGLSRGLFDEFTLARIHQKLHNCVESAGGLIDGIFFCPHGPDEGCHCRKPATGLLEAIAIEFDTDLAGTPLVGDSAKDLEAALKVGARPILVKTGKGQTTLDNLDPALATRVEVVADLGAAVDLILKGN